MTSKTISTDNFAPDTDEIIGDAPLARIVNVERVEDEPMSLTAIFADGTTVKADMSYHLRGHEILEEVAADAQLYAQYRIEESGGLEWPNGADVSATQFQQLAEITAGNMMHRLDFREWLKRHGLIIDTAGPVLGMSRKTIARYSSGEAPIPKHILLACKGYDAAVAEGKPPPQILRPTGFRSETKFGSPVVTRDKPNMSRLRLRRDVIDKLDAFERLWRLAIQDSIRASVDSGKEAVWSLATAPGDGDTDLIVTYNGTEASGFEAFAKLARELEDYIVE